ncbi:MAG TPA: FYVE zinc finger domain-containing protein [Thermoanaerobaculia bacterium]|nr:FYVE zinc finger domain-containing protein [Thermoanaerobaculia bacterium]
MAHEYPPKITDQTFAVANPPPLPVVGACPMHVNQAGVTSVGVQGEQVVGFEEGNAIDLDPVAAGRIRFAPNVDQLNITWAFSGHQFITAARLEVFTAGVVGAVWTHVFNWANAGDRQANGAVAFDGVLANNGANGEFPDTCLTAMRAPYQVSLTILSVEPDTEVTCKRRWFYLDVVIHIIELFLGPKNLMAVQAPTFAENRYLTLNEAMYDELAAQLTRPQQQGPDDLTSPQAPADLEVRLKTNIFSRSSNDFYDNSLFKGMREVWQRDPMLPILARVFVEQNDGQAAPLVAGARALGELELLWDWEGGPGTLPAGSRQRVADFVAAAARYKPDIWPRAGGNCHYDHGGKRGAPLPELVFKPIHPPNAVADRFVVDAPANRVWARYSSVRSDPNDPDAGTTGVLFLPSRIAGDEFRLTVYPVFPDRVTVDMAGAGTFDPVVANLPAALPASKFTVWKIAAVARHWSKHLTADSARLDWVAVNAYFAPARVRLDPPALGVSLIDAANGGDYDNAFGTVWPILMPVYRAAVDWNTPAINGDFGYTMADYDAFLNAVDQWLGQLQQAVQQANPNTVQDVLDAQLQAIGTHDYAEEHLYLDEVGDGQAQIPALRQRVLERLGVTDAESYLKKARKWGEQILSRVASEFQRQVTPAAEGIHLFELQFADDRQGLPNTAEAVTTISNRANCVACNQGLPPLTPQWWTRADRAANRICGTCFTDQSSDVTVLSFAPFRYIDGVLDQWAEDHLSWTDCMKIRAGHEYGTSANLAIAHEIGHQLGLPHAPPAKPKVLGVFTPITTGGIEPDLHDATDFKCVMSYNLAFARELRFCGVCTLRLRGWSAGPSDANTQPWHHVMDVQTITLSNASLQNTGIDRAPGAQWDPDGGAVNCPLCNAAFGVFTRKHHCRRCGHIFCDACSGNTAPVRDPVTENGVAADPPVQLGRVCDPCHLAWTNPD